MNQNMSNLNNLRNPQAQQRLAQNPAPPKQADFNFDGATTSNAPAFDQFDFGAQQPAQNS